MPRYIFAIRAGDGYAPERAAELNDDAAALAYACEIVRELMQGLTHADRRSLVKVRDETRPMVFSIPFFAACVDFPRQKPFCNITSRADRERT
jgi:hypothetical protein